MFGGAVTERADDKLAIGNYIFTVTGAACGWNTVSNDKGVKTRKLAMRFLFQDSEGGAAESKPVNLPFDPQSGFFKSSKSAFYPIVEALLGRPLDYSADQITFAVDGCESVDDIPNLFEKNQRPPAVTSLRVGGVELLDGQHRVRLSVSEGEPFNGSPTTKHVYSADQFVTTPRKPAPKPVATPD